MRENCFSGWWEAENILSTHAGKEIVRFVLFDNIPAVLKMKNSSDNFQIISETIHGTQTTPLEHVKHSLEANYHEGVTDELMDRIKSDDLDLIFRRLQQVEYFFLLWSSLLHNISPHIPRLLGTCDDTYIVEKVEEVLGEKFVLNKSWEEMHPVMNNFFLLIEYLDNNSIQLCDVKLENFGWDPSSQTIKLIDLDTVFLTGCLLDQFRERECSSDRDCHLFSCRGQCDVPAGKCLVEILDNNLARICRDIFAPRFLERGLFSAAPLVKKAELLKLVKKCGEAKMSTLDFRLQYQQVA